MGYHTTSLDHPVTPPQGVAGTILSWPGRILDTYLRYIRAGRELEWIFRARSTQLRTDERRRDDVVRQIFADYGIDLDPR